MAAKDRTNRAGGGRPGQASPAGDDLDLIRLVGVLARRWPIVAAITALFVGIAAVYVVVAPKHWRATSRVLLDPRDKVVVGPGVTQPIPGVDIGWVASQASVVTSAETLASVIRSEGLDRDPDFGEDFDEALREFTESIVVDRDPNSYVLAISVTTYSAEKAARLSSLLSEAFVAELAESKSEGARQVRDMLAAQLADLREKARAADERLQAYRRENGLVAVSGRQVDEETLRQLNERYLTAQQRTREAETRRDSLERILAEGGTRFDSNLDTVYSSVVARLKVEYALASRQFAELAQDLGPSHPRMIAARADVDRARAQIVEELRSLAETARIDYDLALANERQLQQALDEATGAVNAASIAGVELRELEADANVRRELYLNFVARLEQTGLQENIQVSDARVIEPAVVPVRPYWPRRDLVLALAALAGLGIGLSAAVYAGRDDLLDEDEQDAQPDDSPSGHRTEARAGPAETSEPAHARPRRTAQEPAPDAAAQSRSAPPRATAPAPAAVEEAPSEESRVAVAEIDLDARGRGLVPTSNRVSPELLAEALKSTANRSALAGFLNDTGGGLGMLLVVGLTRASTVAAVAYSLARLAAENKRSTLLVDASIGAGPLSTALLRRSGVGLIDVACRAADSADIECHMEGDDLAVIGLGRASEDEVGRLAPSISDFMAELGGCFDLSIVALGERIQIDFLDEMAQRASGVVLVINAADRGDPAVGRTVRDLAATLPRLVGIILASEGVRQERVWRRAS